MRVVRRYSWRALLHNGEEVLKQLRISILMALPVEGDIDLLAEDSGLGDDWRNFKETSPQLQIALLKLIKRAQANRLLFKLLNEAIEKSKHHPDLQSVADKLRHFQDPLTELHSDLDLHELEKVLFLEEDFEDVGRWI